MAVKTITVDVDAYNLLAADKREKESFSGVIKRHFRGTCTGERLLEHVDDLCLSESTVKNIEKLIRSRGKSMAQSPRL